MKNSNRLRGLLLLGVLFMAYGLGLIFGYTPPIQDLRYVTLTEIGWTFLIVGAIMFVSLTAEHDRELYSIATLFSAAWATILAITSEGTNAWAASVAWWCLAFVCLLLSGWPDPPEPHDLPPAPKLEEENKP